MGGESNGGFIVCVYACDEGRRYVWGRDIERLVNHWSCSLDNQ